MAKGIRIAFKISLAIFIFTMTILIMSIFANVLVPEDVLDKPEYAQYGIAPIIKAFKAIDEADFYATIFSGLASLLTYIGKLVWR